MRRIRVLETGSNSAFFNMALDEALMRLSPLPTLRLYSWSPPAVTIGYFQKIEEEVDLDECRRHGVDFTRRITGGGAVFHEHELTYSFVTKDYPLNVLASYKQICAPLIHALKNLGLDAEFVPLNDIVVNGKKVSGNAQTRRSGVLLQHGTILLEVDVNKMFTLLRVPDEKLKDKIVKDVRERVMGIGFPFERVAEAVKEGFASIFEAELFQDSPTEEEIKLAKKIEKERYASERWIYGI